MGQETDATIVIAIFADTVVHGNGPSVYFAIRKNCAGLVAGRTIR